MRNVIVSSDEKATKRQSGNSIGELRLKRWVESSYELRDSISEKTHRESDTTRGEHSH